MTNLAKTLDGIAKDKKASEAREDKKAVSEESLKDDEVLVRLVRPLYLKAGKSYPAGVHKLPRSLVPKSAKILKGDAAKAVEGAATKE